MSHKEIAIDMIHKLPDEVSFVDIARKMELIAGDSIPFGGLRPTRRSQPRPIGLAKGEFIVPTDFNRPLPENTLQLFSGK